jgi:16S rRNA (adenine1518-N6/adenine1519-N6)-dimethyltransferase
MSLRIELENLLNKYNIRPAKIRGQNFLIDEEVLDKIISAADIKSADTVLEIGPGLGFLTERLISRAKKVIAVELDAQLFKILKEKFSRAENLELINQDILKFDFNFIFNNPSPPPFTLRGGARVPSLDAKGGGGNYKIVANIPYDITSAILQKFLTCVFCPQELVLMVQKEVAERICAKQKQSLLSVSVGLYGAPEFIAMVPRLAFYPMPKVDSAILKILPKNPHKINRNLNERALKLAKIGFSHPRRKVISNLAAGTGLSREKFILFFQKAGIDPNSRAENLTPDDWLNLVKTF